MGTCRRVSSKNRPIGFCRISGQQRVLRLLGMGDGLGLDLERQQRVRRQPLGQRVLPRRDIGVLVHHQICFMQGLRHKYIAFFPENIYIRCHFQRGVYWKDLEFQNMNQVGQASISVPDKENVNMIGLSYTFSNQGNKM